MSAKRATITVITKPEPVEAIFVLEVDGTDATKGIIKTTEVALSKEFKPSSTREEDSVATGVVTLFNDSDSTRRTNKIITRIPPNNSVAIILILKREYLTIERPMP